MQWMRTGSKTQHWVLGLGAAGIIAAVLWQVNTPKTVPDALDRGYYADARRLLQPVAAKGDAKAQNMLGNLYLTGLGGRRDYVAARKFYLMAASQAYAPAQINVARLFREGLGVKRDVVRAFAWLQQARINGSERAENHMRGMVGALTLSPNQIQTAKELYGRLEDLMEAHEEQ